MAFGSFALIKLGSFPSPSPLVVSPSLRGLLAPVAEHPVEALAVLEVAAVEHPEDVVDPLDVEAASVAVEEADLAAAVAVVVVSQEVDAVVDCWGGRVVMAPEDLNDKYPVAPIDLTKDLSCPVLGLFGNEDRSPSPAEVDRHEAELKKHGKTYEFHRYDDAGHAFFSVDRPSYRQAAAVDGWQRITDFLARHLAS